MLAAAALGLPTLVLRPGMISGCSSSGACQGGQFVERFLAGVVQMGSFPRVDAPFHICPGTAGSGGRGGCKCSILSLGPDSFCVVCLPPIS